VIIKAELPLALCPERRRARCTSSVRWRTATVATSASALTASGAGVA